LYQSPPSYQEPKYRSLKLSNPRVSKLIVDTPGALDALLALGWELEEGNAELLVCRGTVTMAQVQRCARWEPARAGEALQV